jgi:hypothetical protein
MPHCKLYKIDLEDIQNKYKHWTLRFVVREEDNYMTIEYQRRL